MGLRDLLNKATNTATSTATSLATNAISTVGAGATVASPPASTLPPVPPLPLSSASGALTPIAGISLERYAELAAKMANCDGDLGRCTDVAEQEGVDRNTWDAAMSGWNARMHDPTTAAEVALAYMPLYQAALTAHGGPRASATLDDYIEMLAMINTDLKEGDVRPVPFEPMYERFRINAPKWSQISTDWVARLGADPTLGANFGDRFVARIKELDTYWLAHHTLPW